MQLYECRLGEVTNPTATQAATMRITFKHVAKSGRNWYLINMTKLTPEFIVTQEEIANLFAGEVITNTLARILMVRRPDFLGEAKWEFRYEKRPFSAKISDEGWLHEYHAGRIDIRPGDALRVTLLETVTHDNNGEVIKEDREILAVLGIIKPAVQGILTGLD